VLTLDDLHWADAASLELVAHLLRHPPRRGVMLVLAFRPAPARPLLVDALATAGRERAVVTLPLDPLTKEDAEALLPGGLPVQRRDALFAQAGGNPFYLQELARTAAL